MLARTIVVEGNDKQLAAHLGLLENFVRNMATATTHDGELIGWIELVVTQCVDRRFDGHNLIRVRQVSDRKNADVIFAEIIYPAYPRSSTDCQRRQPILRPRVAARLLGKPG